MRNFLACFVSLALLAAIGSLSAQQTKAKPFASSSAPSGSSSVVADLSSIQVTPATLAYGAVMSGDHRSLEFTLRNDGFVPLSIGSVKFLLGASGNSQAFTLTINGKTYRGAATDVTRGIFPNITLARGQQISATLEFAPVEEQLDAFVLRFQTQTRVADVAVTGLGGHSGDPYLHVVIDGPRWRVDYDENGSEALVLDGSGSHTHEPGHTLAAYEWRVDGTPSSSAVSLSTLLTEPSTSIELEITDDNDPPRSLTGHVDVRVVAPDEVPGVLAYYHDASASGAEALLDAVPDSADFIEQRSGMSLNGAGTVGSSPFTTNVLVRLVGRIHIDPFGVYTFTPSGGAARKLLVDGAEVTEPIFLIEGDHTIEARATDGLGQVQTDEVADVAPDGASGYDVVPFTAE